MPRYAGVTATATASAGCADVVALTCTTYCRSRCSKFSMRAVTDDSDLHHAHLRIDALHRRIEHLETHLRRLHEHVGLGRLPQHPAPLDHEVEAVRQLLAAGREEEALRLHRDITGQGLKESREALQSLSGGF
jgi:hypothetical protein